MAGASAVRAGQAFVEIGADPRKLFAALGKINKQIGALGSSMAGFGTRMAGFGAALGAPIALATAQFASFDDAIRATAAVSGATGDALQSLNDKARELGATTSFTAIQVANLMTELGRAGFKPDEIEAMTGAVLDLARATGTDATLASGIMAATLRQFGLGATEAARAADVLTKAANSTFNTVEGLGESLKYAGPVAKSLGMSLEDTTAILGVLGNVGIQGSEAGTALRRLSVIAAGAGEDLKKIFGISNTDAAGNLKPLVDVLDEINQVTANMPVAERTAKMAEAFGLLGITSANVLSASADGVRGLAESLRGAAGTAAAAAKEMDAGLGGSIRILLSAIEGTALAVGDALAPSLQALAKGAELVSGGLTKIVKDNEELVVAITRVIAVFGGAGIALIGVGSALQLVSFGMGGLLKAASLVVVPLASLITTAFGLVASFVSATASVVTYSAASVAAAVASGTAWALANAPLFALVGILAAVAAAIIPLLGGFDGLATSIGGSFSVAVKGATSLFSELGSIASDALNGIHEALVGGDLQGAMEVAMAGVVAAFSKGTSALLKNLDGTWANILNTFDAMKAYAAQPLMMVESIKDPFVEADRKALKDRQDARLAGVDSRAAERDAKNATAMQNLGDKVSGVRNRRVQGEQFAELLKNIEGASTIGQLQDLYGEFDALSQNGRLTSQQAATIEAALEDAQERISKAGSAAAGGAAAAGGSATNPDDIQQAAGDAAQNQGESVGSFSAFAASGMGVGSSIPQKQLETLQKIEQNTRDADSGVVKE